MKLLLLSCLVVLAAAAPKVADLEWENWKQENEKLYESDDVESLRYSVWKDNQVLIESHNKNAEEHGYTLGMNPYGDLTAEEFSAMFNGYKMAPLTNFTRGAFKGSDNFVADDNVDWRDKGAVTPVKNQGQCGSCWAFSATGSLEGQHFLKAGQLVSLSEQNLIDCSTAEGDNGCKGGLMDNAFRYIIKNGGIDTEESYPYQAHNEFCRFKESSIGATMTSFRDIEHGDVDALTQAVDQIGPISVAMDASRSSFHLYKQGVYKDRQCSSKKLDHGVLAVGYGTSEGTPCFLVKNSWGTSWGMEGYFMIERSSANMCGLATQASYPIV